MDTAILARARDRQTSQRTLRMPKGLRPANCGGCSPWSALNLCTRGPTSNGPMVVHEVITQMTTRTISELSFPVVWPTRKLLAKSPLPPATDAIMKPISPCLTIAVPRIEAGYNDKGFDGSTDVFRATCCEFCSGFPPIAWQTGPSFAIVAVLRIAVLRDPQQCHLNRPNVFMNAVMADNRIGYRTSQ